MKINSLHLVTNLFKSLAIAITLILPEAMATAQAEKTLLLTDATRTVGAQNMMLDVPNVPVNGLFVPTAAQKFYEAGREDFAREVDFLANPKRFLNGDILQIDEGLIRQPQQFAPEGKPENIYQLDIDLK